MNFLITFLAFNFFATLSGFKLIKLEEYGGNTQDKLFANGENRHWNWVCNKHDSIVFFEGNGCTQQAKGSLAVEHGKEHRWDRDEDCPVKSIKAHYWDCIDNDEARSMAILPNFPKGGLIRVADHPSDFRQDDWSKIMLKRELPPDTVYCVSSFERSFEDSIIKTEHHHVNGLDGKVSSISACID